MKRLSKNFIALFVSDIVVKILGFVATVYIARVLDISGFGLISYGVAFLNYILLFCNPGLTTIGVREIAKDIQHSKIIGEVIGIRTSLSLIIFLLFGIGLILAPGSALTKKIIFFYALCMFPASFLLEFVFQGRQEMEFIGIGRIIQYGVYLFLLFFLLKSSGDILMVPISFLIGYSAVTLFLLFAFLKRYKSFYFSFRNWRALFATAIPVGMATALNQISVNLPAIILGIFHSKSEVGVFTAGLKIIVVFLIIERVFYYIFFPIIAQQYSQAPEKLSRSFSFMIRIIFAITVPVLFGGLILSSRIIVGIYGPAFARAAGVFSILLFYFFLSPLNTILGYGLVALDKERLFFRIITISSVVNFLSLFILGIYYQAAGAAIGLIIGEVIGVILMYRTLRRYVRFSFLGSVVKALPAGFLMLILLYIFRGLNIVFLIIMSAVIYGFVFYLTGGVSSEELRFLKKSLK